MADTVSFRIPSPLSEGYQTNPLSEDIGPKEVGYQSEGSGL